MQKIFLSRLTCRDEAGHRVVVLGEMVGIYHQPIAGPGRWAKGTKKYATEDGREVLPAEGADFRIMATGERLKWAP